MRYNYITHARTRDLGHGEMKNDLYKEEIPEQNGLVGNLLLRIFTSFPAT